MNNSSQQHSFLTTDLQPGDDITSIRLSIKLAMSLAIIFTNVIVLVVVHRVQPIFRSIDILLVNLAVVDVLTGFSIIFELCLDIQPQLMKTRLMCIFYLQLPFFFMLTSVYIILLVALERYVIIFHNTIHQKLRKSRYCTVVSIAAAYTVAGFVNLYPFLFQSNSVSSNFCFPNHILDKVYMLCRSANIWIVVIMCSVIYVKIICAIRRQMRMTVPFTEQYNEPQRTMNPRVFTITTSPVQTNPPFTKLKLIRLRLAVTIGFAICCLPGSSLAIFHFITPLVSFQTHVGKLFAFLGLANSFINPIMYIISRRRLRQGLRNLLCGSS